MKGLVLLVIFSLAQLAVANEAERIYWALNAPAQKVDTSEFAVTYIKEVGRLVCKVALHPETGDVRESGCRLRTGSYQGTDDDIFDALSVEPQVLYRGPNRVLSKYVGGLTCNRPLRGAAVSGFAWCSLL